MHSTSKDNGAGQGDAVAHRRPSIDSPNCSRSSATEPIAFQVSVIADVATSTKLPHDDRAARSLTAYASTAGDLTLLQSSHCLRTTSRSSSRPRPEPRRRSPPAAVPTSPPPSDMDLTHHLYQLLEQVSCADDVDLVDVYTRASLLPPVTHDSLSELDIVRIINNPKLRHDVNFDKELHFRPNLDGTRGRHKLKAAEDYWKSLVAELELYRVVGMGLAMTETRADTEYWTRLSAHCQKRLPAMFETMRDVLKTLVPERDQAAVIDRLDIPMMMQQISRGLFDLMSLASWLSRLLKAHCAPMRDEWIDRMVGEVQCGVDETSQGKIVAGLRQLLGILESMKLDVANHQIRHLRGLLIEDTINFQQRYHVHRLSSGRLDVTRALRWINKERLSSHSSTNTSGTLALFTSALFKAVLSPTSLTTLPETFQLDVDRLRAIRHDLHYLMTLEMCSDMYQELLIGHGRADVVEDNKAKLRLTLCDILGDRRRPADHAGNLAAEIVRTANKTREMSKDEQLRLEDYAEAKLKRSLPMSSEPMGLRARALFEKYVEQLYMSIKTNARLTTTALHEAMMGRGNLYQPITSTHKSARNTFGKRHSLDEVLRRITHVAVLHWQVWSDLVYQSIPEDISPMPRDMAIKSASSSDSHGNESLDDSGTSPVLRIDTETDRDTIMKDASESHRCGEEVPEMADMAVDKPETEP